MYLRAARSIALHTGVCMNGDIADGYLVKFYDNKMTCLQRVKWPLPPPCFAKEREGGEGRGGREVGWKGCN